MTRQPLDIIGYKGISKFSTLAQNRFESEVYLRLMTSLGLSDASGTSPLYAPLNIFSV